MDKCHGLGYDLQVQTVVTDFEGAVPRAVSSSFGRGVQNKGCFYHLTQSTWRKVQQLGLTNHYKTDENFRLFCGMMDGLAFLPPDFVSDGMDYLKEIVAQKKKLKTSWPTSTRHMCPGHSANNHRMVKTRNKARSRISESAKCLHCIHTQYGTHMKLPSQEMLVPTTYAKWNNKFENLVGHHHSSVWKTITWFHQENATVQALI